MQKQPHIERHFTSSEVVRDLVIGMSDGLTVPFALAAGLSGTAAGTAIIVTAGIAEIAAGSIAMGLGGYLAARGDAEHFASEVLREHRELVEKPEAEAAELSEIFQRFGLTQEETVPLVQALQARPDACVDFMMRFELGLEAPDPKRAFVSAVTIAGAYIFGGLVPLLPYMLVRQPNEALPISVAATLIALGIFGYGKARFTGIKPIRGAVQTVVIGGIAAAAAFGIARLLGG
jgi:VIT1/CCC1 family predicted Fe2+/Mn2+ transporter